MREVLVLGAGMVARPLVRYLLEEAGFSVTVASRTLSKAERLIDNHPRGEAYALDVHKERELEDFVKKSDLVVSLLPYIYHVKVARFCIKHKKDLVTTSYVSEEMRALDNKTKDADILILNECGLDPGIDHMSAMRVIHKVKSKGGKILSFRSTTGALPAHDSNNNPFGYKFSWSPRGVLLASKNDARWLENGRVVSISGEELFEHYTIQDVPGVGSFENYPNRDSLPYKEIYGLQDAKTVYRGTFRMIGWCETLRCLVALGWLDDKPLRNFSGKTYGDVTSHLIKGNKVAKFLGVKNYSAVIKRLEWLGLFSKEPLPENANSPLDYLTMLMLKKMSMEEKDRDMVVMYHEFIADYGFEREYLTSLLVDYGIAGGDSAVARTVALPAAIAVRMILNGDINLKGVHIPVIPEIYDPILDELEGIGIRFVERIERL